MKTKPFNLSEALAGARVVTRDGREVTQLHQFAVAIGDSLSGVICGELFSWKPLGRYVDDSIESNADLFLLYEPKKITLYGAVVFHKDKVWAQIMYVDEDQRIRGLADIQRDFRVVTFEHEVEVPGERE